MGYPFPFEKTEHFTLKAGTDRFDLPLLKDYFKEILATVFLTK
jgi:hypothetical protein